MIPYSRLRAEFIVISPKLISKKVIIFRGMINKAVNIYMQIFLNKVKSLPIGIKNGDV